MTNALRVVHAPSGRILGERIARASNFLTRLRGLLGRRGLAEGEGLLLERCPAVHTYGMGFALDVAFLRPDGRVQAIYPALMPSRRTGWHQGAAAALELPPGTLARAGVQLGDRLELVPSRSAEVVA